MALRSRGPSTASLGHSNSRGVLDSSPNPCLAARPKTARPVPRSEPPPPLEPSRALPLLSVARVLLLWRPPGSGQSGFGRSRPRSRLIPYAGIQRPDITQKAIPDMTTEATAATSTRQRTTISNRTPDPDNGEARPSLRPAARLRVAAGRGVIPGLAAHRSEIRRRVVAEVAGDGVLVRWDRSCFERHRRLWILLQVAQVARPEELVEKDGGEGAKADT